MPRKSLAQVAKLIKDISSDSPVEKQFLNDLKYTIETKASEEQRKPSQTYKPSSMNCMRAMYYQVIGVEQDSEKANYVLVGICNSGSDIHIRIQQAVESMKDCGIDCEYIDVGDYVVSRSLNDIEVVAKSGMETKLYHKKLNMSFLCDGIIRYKGKYYILELKTETSYKFSVRKGVDPNHYNQATAYSTAFGIDKVLFVYICRDNLDMKSYMFKVTDEMCKSFIERINRCDGYVKTKQVPPKEESTPRKSCTYCPYKNQCERDK